jgi:radical SAM protein with 4Fe4S-binding SPASM domain
LINRFNEHEVELARQIASDIGVEIYFLLMSVWGKEEWISSYHKDPDKLAALQKGDSAAERRNTADSLRMRAPSLPRKAVAHVDAVRIHDHFPWWCAQVFHTMAINTDGSVSPCTEIADARFNVGNLLTDEIDDIWNGEQFRRSRRYVMHREVNGSICELCVRGEGAWSK